MKSPDHYNFGDLIQHLRQIGQDNDVVVGVYTNWAGV